MPKTCTEVPEDVLDPPSFWGNEKEYWEKDDALAARFIENFKLFEQGVTDAVKTAGPIRLKNAK